MCMYMNMFVATHKYEKMLSVKQPQHIRLKAEHTYVKKVPLTCSFRRLTLLLSGEQQVECHLQEAAGVLNKTIVSLSYLKRQHVQTYKQDVQHWRLSALLNYPTLCPICFSYYFCFADSGVLLLRFMYLSAQLFVALFVVLCEFGLSFSAFFKNY